MTHKALSSLTVGVSDTGDYLYGAVGGNSRKVQIGQFLSPLQTSVTQLESNKVAKDGDTMTGTLFIEASDDAGEADYIAARPTDYGPGKPGFFIYHDGPASWEFSLW